MDCSSILKSIFDENIKIKKIGMGENRISYLITTRKDKRYICKKELNSEETNKKEYHILTTLKDHNFSPKPYQFNEEHNILVLEYIEGDTLEKDRINKKTLEELAYLLYEIHTTSVNITYKVQKTRKELEWYIQELKKYKVDEKIIDTFSKLINEIKPLQTKPKMLIHADVCPQNIIRTKNGELKLIDWESAGMGNNLVDLAQAIINFRLKGKRKEQFLQLYEELSNHKINYNDLKEYIKFTCIEYAAWELVRVQEIKHKKLPSEYLKNTTIEDHLQEAIEVLDFMEEWVN